MTKTLIFIYILTCGFGLKSIVGSTIGNVAKTSCNFQKVYHLYSYLSKEIFYSKTNGFKCEIKNSDFIFDLDKNDQLLKNKFNKIIKGNTYMTIEMKWSKN